MENKIKRLSEKAVQEFRNIYQEEFDEVLTDAEAAQRALEVLRVFKIIADDFPIKKPDSVLLTDDEQKALQYIKHCLENNVHPTIRGMTQAIGRHSSRSGQRMLQKLMRRGLVSRDDKGKI